MSANMKGFAGEELYEEGDDWSDDMADREVPDYWGEEIENAERKMLDNGFSKPYVASMIARMKAEKKREDV